MNHTYRLVQKILSGFSCLSILLHTLIPSYSLLTHQAYAQEVIVQELPTTTPSLDPSFSSLEPTPTPANSTSENSLTDSATPSVTQTPSATVTPTEMVTPTPTEDPIPTETEPPKKTPPPLADQPVTSSTTSDLGQILDGVSTTASPTPTPAVIATKPQEGGLETVILKNVEATSLDLDSIDPYSSAMLTSDKADYAPTDTALISGSGLTPDTTYSLTVSSSDDPATSTTVSVTTDRDGSFSYSYQLDSIYRPNYTVTLKNLNGRIVATMSFTDGGPKIDKLYSNAGLTTENYLFALGSTVYVKATNLNATRGYKLEAKNAAGTSVYTGTCKTGSTTASDSYTPTTLSGSSDWTWVLHEWTTSTCASGAQSEDADNTQAFNVAQATSYTTSTLGTLTTSYTTGSTAYVVINGLKRSDNDWSVTWVKPDTSTACQNTGGGDRPDTTSAGVMPDAAPNYLEYPPATGNNNWNDPTKYDGTCPAFTSGNIGAWTLTLVKDSTHSVSLPVFSVNSADTTAPTLSPVTIQSNNANTSIAKVGDVVTVSFSASESVSGTSVTIAGQTASLSGSGTGPYSATFTMTSSQSNGLISFAISGFKDAANNTGTTVIATTNASSVTFDKTSPSITITNPSTAPAQSKTITASTDEGTLTQSVTTGSICDGTLTYISYVSTTFGSESDNGKKICYRAVDTAGNTSYSMSAAIAGIDTTKPVTSITGVTDGNSNAVTSGGLTKSNSLSVAFSASDTSGIAGSECQLDTGSYSACSTPKLYSGLSDGSHTINIRSTDTAGTSNPPRHSAGPLTLLLRILLQKHPIPAGIHPIKPRHSPTPIPLVSLPVLQSAAQFPLKALLKRAP